MPIKNDKNWHFWLLLTILIVGGGLIHWREAIGEIRPARKPLRDFPAQIGEWRRLGEDQRFDESVESVLRADDYLMRNYYLPASGVAANVYVGYYASQRAGATYHSPRNCLPGSGWIMTRPETIEIELPDNRRFPANRYVLQNGADKHLMIYWYQGRGRATANEYVDKIFTVWDGIARRRSDAAMIRVMTPIGKSEADAQKAAEDLSVRIASDLSEFVPD